MSKWLKNFKPTTNGLRNMQVFKKNTFSNFFEKPALLVKVNEKSGRNNTGHTTVRFRKKRKFKKKIDISDNKRVFSKGIIVSLKFDPITKSNIALLSNKKGFFKVKATTSLKVGSLIVSASNQKNLRNLGFCCFVYKFPVGSIISNLITNSKATYIKAGGSYGRLVAKIPGKSVIIEMPSKIKKIFPWKTKGVLGSNSNSLKKFVNLGKAEKKKIQGFKSHIKGVVMNPVDHPHGGGTGKSTTGRNPVTPWGRLTTKRTVKLWK